MGVIGVFLCSLIVCHLLPWSVSGTSEYNAFLLACNLLGHMYICPVRECVWYVIIYILYLYRVSTCFIRLCDWVLAMLKDINSHL